MDDGYFHPHFHIGEAEEVVLWMLDNPEVDIDREKLLRVMDQLRRARIGINRIQEQANA